jgi:hypothetical protein
MAVYLYFSLIPEALIASMLPSEEFGHYLAVGSKYLTKGEAVFCELDPGFRDDYFEIEAGIQRCTPHPDGTPKNSVYISIYRVLEHLPISAMGKLYLVTDYGQSLPLESIERTPESTGRYHLYQDLAPVTSLVVSNLHPEPYYQSVTTRPSKLIHLPALAFVELELGDLAEDPEHGSIGDLPYSGIPHMRECMMELETKQKNNKLVDRLSSAEFPYRMVKTGFYIGNGADLAFYPMPSHELLRDNHHHWWRMANL